MLADVIVNRQSNNVCNRERKPQPSRVYAYYGSRLESPGTAGGGVTDLAAFRSGPVRPQTLCGDTGAWDNQTNVAAKPQEIGGHLDCNLCGIFLGSHSLHQRLERVRCIWDRDPSLRPSCLATGTQT